MTEIYNNKNLLCFTKCKLFKNDKIQHYPDIYKLLVKSNFLNSLNASHFIANRLKKHNQSHWRQFFTRNYVTALSFPFITNSLIQMTIACVIIIT